jgi:hypothetical protein
MNPTDGKRGGAQALVLPPILDSTEVPLDGAFARQSTSRQTVFRS